MIGDSFRGEILDDSKCGARSMMEGDYTLGVFGFGQWPAQSVERNYRAARIVHSEDPFAADAGI